MIRYITALLAVSMFAVGTWAQNSPPHLQDVSIVYGAKNPELIPDNIAYRLYLFSLTVPANASEHERQAQAGRLATLNLTVPEDSQVLNILADFRSRYDAWIARWNAEAQQQQEHFDPTLVLQVREDIVADAQRALQSSLTVDRLIRFTRQVQQEKRHMRIITGGSQ